MYVCGSVCECVCGGGGGGEQGMGASLYGRQDQKLLGDWVTSVRSSGSEVAG